MIAPVSTCTMKCYKRHPDLIHNSEGRGGDRRRILPGVSGGRFPCNFIPGPWLRQFSEFLGRNIGWIAEEGAWQTSVRYYSRPSTFNCGVLMGSARGGEAARRRILTGVSGGRFPCSSYGIATLTAGSLEFQDFIPGPWLRQF
uniref:Uncharacterized protein n=1 Tax=Salix viminalis TaxID=40686 RepID=A0A6N2KH83_SALVM